jgi:hypothetical protein
MPQIINITSEALQATIRRLLPSQQGFGLDLQATNVVTPIIDLTPTAEGSVLPSDLARAHSFDSNTAFNAANSTATVANTAGFYRVIFGITCNSNAGQNVEGRFELSDGLSTKTLWKWTQIANSQFPAYGTFGEFTVFLASGESLSAVSVGNEVQLHGSSRQVASVNGEIQNPTGFVQQ